MLDKISKMVIYAIIFLLVITGAAPIVAQSSEQAIDLPEEMIPETYIIGDLNLSLLKIRYVPLISEINTTSDEIFLKINYTVSGVSFGKLVSKVVYSITDPSGRVAILESIENVDLIFTQDGIYVVRISYHSWIPVVGGLVDAIVGSGDYEIQINKTTPLPPPPPPPNKMKPVVLGLLIAGITAVIIVVIKYSYKEDETEVLRE